MLNPFSAVETPHRVEAGGRSWFANCAWDALGISAALHADGDVRSECPDCAEPLELEIRDGRVARGADLLVHFVVPARRWWEDLPDALPGPSAMITPRGCCAGSGRSRRSIPCMNARNASDSQRSRRSRAIFDDSTSGSLGPTQSTGCSAILGSRGFAATSEIRK